VKECKSLPFDLSVPFLHRSSLLALWQALFRSLAPLGDRVLVKRAPKELQTASGIYLPTDKTKDPNEGEVMAVGPGERDVTGQLHPTSLQKGDQVLLPEYGGTKVKIGEDEMFLFRESDILAKFD
jgi:chaperonin GroES